MIDDMASEGVETVKVCIYIYIYIYVDRRQRQNGVKEQHSQGARSGLYRQHRLIASHSLNPVLYTCCVYSRACRILNFPAMMKLVKSSEKT